MNATELIAEARGLCEKATPGPWEQCVSFDPKDSTGCYFVQQKHSHPAYRIDVRAYGEQASMDDAAFIAQARTLLPALCDALESLQSTLEQTWEWDMYQAAKREIERLKETNKALESDIYNAEMNLAHLTSELEAVQNAQRWIPVAEKLPDGAGLVLALVNGKPHPNITLHGAYMLAEYSASEGWIISEYLEWEDAEVTHWMPLPAPPKGED